MKLNVVLVACVLLALFAVGEAVSFRSLASRGTPAKPKAPKAPKTPATHAADLPHDDKFEKEVKAYIEKKADAKAPVCTKKSYGILIALNAKLEIEHIENIGATGKVSFSKKAAHFAVIFFHQDKAKSAAAKKAFVALAEAQKQEIHHLVVDAKKKDDAHKHMKRETCPKTKDSAQKECFDYKPKSKGKKDKKDKKPASVQKASINQHHHEHHHHHNDKKGKDDKHKSDKQ